MHQNAVLDIEHPVETQRGTINSKDVRTLQENTKFSVVYTQ